MEWWHIVLILLGSAVVGVFGGIILFRLINYFKLKKDRFIFTKGRSLLKRGSIPLGKKPRFKALPVFEAQRQAATKATEEPADKKADSMVPILSRRSLTVLGIGLIVGILLGVGYWAISPINADLRMGWPPVDVASIFEKEPTIYQSTVKVSLIAPGASFASLHDLQKQGEYYISRINTLHFWEFFSEKLASQEPKYAHSAEELAQIITARYDWNSDNPALEIKATSLYGAEALFLASNTPTIFQEYLIADENNMRLEEYQKKVKEMEVVKAALFEAETELANLRLETSAYDMRLNPDYIALSARVASLERMLTSLTDELALLYAQSNNSSTSGRSKFEVLGEINSVSAALSTAKNELAILESEATLDNMEQNVAYSATQSKVTRLSGELNLLTQQLALLATANTQGPETVGYLTIEDPTPPVAVPPEKILGRNAIMMGALLGIGGAWLIMNRRWLATGVLSSSPAKGGSGEEEKV